MGFDVSRTSLLLTFATVLDLRAVMISPVCLSIHIDVRNAQAHVNRSIVNERLQHQHTLYVDMFIIYNVRQIPIDCINHSRLLICNPCDHSMLINPGCRMTRQHMNDHHIIRWRTIHVGIIRYRLTPQDFSKKFLYTLQ